jgi:hypothetical protein
MSWIQWILWTIIVCLYITCLFTVCVMTFRKGRTVLGVIGIFIPLLWLIGAWLPAREGSRYDIDQGIAYSQQMEQYTR